MDENKSILHELYVFSEWKPEPEYIQKPDNLLPENISALWRWLKFLGPKKSLIDSVTAHKEKQQKWKIALGDKGKVIAILTDNILEIRFKRSEYATIAARTTVSRDGYPQWRKLAWSPDCSFLVLAYGNGVVSFFDLTASNLFNIPTDCSRPGGLECTDNTHAVADIIFMPLRVKDKKWNWEVLVVTHDGKLRAFVVSTEGYKLQHTFRFPGGAASAAYSAAHATLYVASVPCTPRKDPTSALSAGLTAWRVLYDAPFYKLSVVCDQAEALLPSHSFALYVPFVYDKTTAFIVYMVLSPDNNKLVCLHCNGDVTIWRLPLLKHLHRWPLLQQPQHDLNNPLIQENKPKKEPTKYHAADVNWWSNEELILSRFNGAISICGIEDMINILGKRPEFFQGTPQVSPAYDGAFMVLECESTVLPAKRRSDESMEVVRLEEDKEDSMADLMKELVKYVLYNITDMEAFQPRPRRITIVSRVYRLLALKSTTPYNLFCRKIESGNYTEALALAETFQLDSDLVYQQQWRKNTVSTHAIQKYLSKVSKKIWVVHQCVDRLPETLPAARGLLQFGLELTDKEILSEINKERDDQITNTSEITLEHLNAYSSELLRCRHVMLFYKERLKLYEAILKCEKSTYVKDEYDRLRSNSIVHSSIEIAKEGRIEALTCLWPHLKTTAMQLAVLGKLPETINPLDYKHLLPITSVQAEWLEREVVVEEKSEHENDWCRKEVFRSIWSSNWSEDTTPESSDGPKTEISKWYEARAREIEKHSGIVSHALTLITLAAVGGGVEGLDHIMFHLLTLDTLIYDLNIEGIVLPVLERLSILENCKLLMKMATPATFVADLKQFVIPFLKRFENLTNGAEPCLGGLTEYLENISTKDLSYILLVLQSPTEFELDVRTHLELAERCLFAYDSTDQLDKACDLLDTILKESDGTICPSELVRRVGELERLVSGSVRISWRGVQCAPSELRVSHTDPRRAKQILSSLSVQAEKPTPQDWEKLLKDILELQSTLFNCISKEECYEIYALSLLRSGDAAHIRLASEVLLCYKSARRGSHLVNYERSVELVTNAAREYFNSSSTLNDPALELAKCCLNLIKDGNPEVLCELDLIAALYLLNAFNMDIIPIQVRLCENKMSLIEDCLKSHPAAYLASDKLLKLAKLFRISEQDELTREGEVLKLVCSYALAAGAGGRAAATDAARRLAALRHAGAARLLARAAAHAPPPANRELLAAAATYCTPKQLPAILKERMGLELANMQQLGLSMKQQHGLANRGASTDDEFADAITTPIIEKKDLVPPAQYDKIPLFNYLLDTFQNKFSIGDNKSINSEAIERTVHCQEFYHTLYQEHSVSNSFYRYERFVPDAAEPRAPTHSVLSCYYTHSCLDPATPMDVECSVLQKCAEELMYRDTALAVACLLRSTEDVPQTRALLESNASRAAVAAALYAALLRCNAPELRDHVYLTPPLKMARNTLKRKNASGDQTDLINKCIEKLSSMGEVEALKEAGYSANAVMFHADRDYRAQMIYRVARSPDPSHLQMALSLAAKYGVDATDVWLQHAASRPLSAVDVALPPQLAANPAHTVLRVKEVIWPEVPGDDHNAMISFFSILKGLDEKTMFYGLTPAEHIKLLKKAKAASSELDYKVLLGPAREAREAHVAAVMSADNAGALGKFLRALPAAVWPGLALHRVYAAWLTNYFFSVSPGSASSKKWMQQYRQCASFFNKLGKQDLLQLIENVCFSDEAVHRVPQGTRYLMIMQAVDYCQQEQENDFKFNKNEQSWAQVGQELGRRARFLDNYWSEPLQAIRQATRLPEAWLSIEMSHGCPEKMVDPIASLVLAGVKSSTLASTLQCLHVELAMDDVFRHIVDRRLTDVLEAETLVSRLTAYHKDGVKLSEQVIDAAMHKSTALGLPPHKQISLLSLTQKCQIQDAGDLEKIAQFSVDLFKNEWSDLDFVKELSEQKLTTEEGRREVFAVLSKECTSWQRRRALVDALACWPALSHESSKSLHCEYLHGLLTSGDQKESLALIKLLLRRPILIEEEVQWLIDSVSGEAVVNAIWLVLLNKCEHFKENIIKLVVKNKDTLTNQEIEDDLVKQLLDNGMFLDLVSTPLYAAIVNYVLQQQPTDDIESYNVQWATKELLKNNYIAEAGHLQLLSMGVPSPLRGFSQSVLYCKNIFKK